MAEGTREGAPPRLPPIPDNVSTIYDVGAVVVDDYEDVPPENDATDLRSAPEIAQTPELQNQSQALPPEDAKKPKTVDIPSVPSSWLSTKKFNREIPKAAKAGAVGVALLLLLVFVVPSTGGSQAETKHSSMITAADVENGERLKKRRSVTDEYFRVHGAGPIRVGAGPSLSNEKIDLEARARQRDDTPRISAQQRRLDGARSINLGKSRVPLWSRRKNRVDFSSTQNPVF